MHTLVSRFRVVASAGVIVMLTIAAIAVATKAPGAAASSSPWSACTSGLNVSSSPRQPYPDGGTLYAVSAPSAADAWAVGELDGPSLSLPLVEHWDGSAWTVSSVNLPALDGGAVSQSRFDTVAAFSPTDVWAGGFQDEANGDHSVIAHWDGSAWSLRTFPSAEDFVSVQAVGGSGGGDVWVALQTNNGVSYVAHYDGSSWFLHQAPITIQSLTALGPDQVALGGEANGSAAIAEAPLDQVYVGNWSVIPDYGIAGVSDLSGNQPDDLWAVGEPESGLTNWTLQHYTTSGWTDFTSAFAGIVATSDGAGNAEAVWNSFGGPTPEAFEVSDPNGPVSGPISETNLAWDPSWGTELYIRGIAATPRGALFAVGSLRENGVPDIQQPIVFRDCPS